MTPRTLVISGVLAAAVPLMAHQQTELQQGQTAAPAPAAVARPTPGPEVTRAVRMQIQRFDVLLQDALSDSIRKFAQWVAQVYPGVLVEQAQRSSVQGFVQHDGSFFFTVQQPELIGQQFIVLQFRDKSMPGPPTSGRVNAAGAVPADPEPLLPAPPPRQYEGCARRELKDVDPNEKLRDCVLDGLIDAILDGSIGLQLKAGQSLTVAHVPVEALHSNFISTNVSSTLTLSISAEDLDLYHQSKIPRDEAIRRITKQTF